MKKCIEKRFLGVDREHYKPILSAMGYKDQVGMCQECTHFVAQEGSPVTCSLNAFLIPTSCAGVCDWFEAVEGEDTEQEPKI